jgi:hypothetical protein
VTLLCVALLIASHAALASWAWQRARLVGFWQGAAATTGCLGEHLGRTRNLFEVVDRCVKEQAPDE